MLWWRYCGVLRSGLAKQAAERRCFISPHNSVSRCNAEENLPSHSPALTSHSNRCFGTPAYYFILDPVSKGPFSDISFDPYTVWLSVSHFFPAYGW